MTGAVLLVVPAAVLGLAVGSFLNVVVYRVPRAESIVRPGSHCPACATPIRRRHNVPVLSWLALRGRCAACRAPISARYPLVEAGTALLFVALTVRFGLSADLPAYLYLTATALALALIDVEVRAMPDSIVVPSYVVGALLLVPTGAARADWAGLLRALTGTAVLLAVFFALSVAYPNGMAFADVKVAGLLGLFLGWLSWSTLLVGVAGGLLLAVAGGLVALLSRRAASYRAVPLGPCLIAAAVLALFVTAPLLHCYTALTTA